MSGTGSRCRRDPRRQHDRAAALAYLGVTCSHPDWLVARWLDRYGFDQTEAWVQFNNSTAPLTLRANTLRVSRDQLQDVLSRHDVETAPTRYAPDGLTVTSGNPLRTSEDESFFVQDEASQLVPLVVDAQPGERILDLCASPGGKTVAMAASMNDSGTLVACDVRVGRVALLRDTVRRSGAHHAAHRSRAGQRPAALREHVRSRARGCSVLGPGDDSPRSGHSLATRGERSAASGRPADRAADACGRDRAAGRPSGVRDLLQRA